MSQLDKVKEMIGYLKVWFGVTVAVLLSVIAWSYKNFSILTTAEKSISIVLILVLSFAILYLNRKILKKIDELEEL